MKRILVLAALMAGLSHTALATELVYTPINPSFGGNPLNGSHLLNTANAQNKFKEKQSSGVSKDPLKDFQDGLMRRILSSLSSQIVDTAFGQSDDPITSGHYEFGDYTVDVNVQEGVSITATITDVVTGETTTIEVPFYQTDSGNPKMAPR